MTAELDEIMYSSPLLPANGFTESASRLRLLSDEDESCKAAAQRSGMNLFISLFHTERLFEAEGG